MYWKRHSQKIWITAPTTNTLYTRPLQLNRITCVTQHRTRVTKSVIIIKTLDGAKESCPIFSSEMRAALTRSARIDRERGEGRGVGGEIWENFESFASNSGARTHPCSELNRRTQLSCAHVISVLFCARSKCHVLSTRYVDVYGFGAFWNTSTKLQSTVVQICHSYYIWKSLCYV